MMAPHAVLSEMEGVGPLATLANPRSAILEQKGFKMTSESRITRNKGGTGAKPMAMLENRTGVEVAFGSHELPGEAETGWLERPAHQIECDNRPVMLTVGCADRADVLGRWGERAGLRCIGRVGLDHAVDRLAQMAALDLILLDLRGLDVAYALDPATARTLAARHGFAGARLAVIVDMGGLDCALAMLDAPKTDFLCDPDDSEIVSLLVMAGLRAPAPGRVLFDDASRDSETMRLEQLSAEVRRLAVTIERMSQGVAPASGVADGMQEAREERGGYRAAPAVENAGNPAQLFQPRAPQRGPEPGGLPTHREIRAIIRARRLRDQFLPADLFADPAWDMLLDLLAARLAGQRVSVSSLCIAAAVPPTTALRWIRQLTDRAVFARIDDPADGRRVFIELTDAAAQAVLSWAQGVRRNGGLLASTAR
jgi:DNA-binding MarR family transcriptional regulator